MYKITFLILLFCTQLSAAIYHCVDTTMPLYCTFSNRHHNRILIDQGRIKKVIFQEEKLLVKMEEVSGQVFVQAKHLMPEPVLISIVTSEGLIQDIEITFAEGQPEVIILTPSSELKEPYQEVCDISYEMPTLYNSINTILKGHIPACYKSTPFRGCVFKPKRGLCAKLVGRLVGSTETLCIYEVTNTTFFKRKLTETEISAPNILWSFVQKHCYAPKEKGLAIVAVPNER